MFSRETRCISSVPNSASFLSSATPGFVALKTDDSNQGAFTQRLTEIKPSAESAQAIQQTEEHLKHLKLFPDGVAEKFDKHLNASNQTKADAVPVEQLGEKELLQMKFGEGIRAVLSQSKTVVSMLDEGLKGSQALDEAARLSIQLRAEIVRDVEALSHILQQEHENLGVLRRYEREQDALLKAQLGRHKCSRACLCMREKRAFSSLNRGKSKCIFKCKQLHRQLITICGASQFQFETLLML
ncbi:hypothetical protein Efla_005707 [Eimeria flavescens]